MKLTHHHRSESHLRAATIAGAYSRGLASLAAFAALAVAGPTYAATYDVALGAPVTVAVQDPDPNAVFNNMTAGNLNNITDGIVLPYGTGYNSSTAVQNAVEWGGAQTVFQINLSGEYTLSSIAVDADDNDAYIFEYLDPASNSWTPLYTAPIVSNGVGIVPRAPYTLPTPVTTSAVRFHGGQSNDNGCFDGTCGQGGYAVAQVQLFGTPAAGSVTESYTPSDSLVTIPALAIGNTTFLNTVLVFGGLVSGPTGSAPAGTVDSYDPVTGQLTVQSITLGSTTYYNLVVKVAGVVSVASAIGTDSLVGGQLTIPAVQVGNTIYTNVTLSIGLDNLVSVGGQLPTATQDTYDVSTGTLSVPSMSAFGTVFTNVKLHVTLADVVHVGGSHAAQARSP